MSQFQRRLRLLHWHARYYGWPMAALRLCRQAGSAVGLHRAGRHRMQLLEDRAFDRRWCVDTGGTVEIDDLAMSATRREHAVEYVPTPAASLACLLDSLPIDHASCSFIDIGCGKGRVLLVAAAWPFRSVTGVELATDLAHTAEQNLASIRARGCRCQKLAVLNMDAAEYRFPEGPLVVFLYNPFSAEVLQLVVDRLREALQEQPRPVTVIYHNPRHSEVIENSGLFREGHQDLRPNAGWQIFTFRVDRPVSPALPEQQTVPARASGQSQPWT